MAGIQEDLNMKPSIQTHQGQIDQHATEGAPHHAKPFEAATAAQKASQASRLARWLPTPGNVIFTLLAIGLLIMTQNVWSAPSLANTPGPSATTVNYQGRLADSSGNPLSGSYNLQFAIYDAPTGGNRVWAPENHLGVPVTDGLFSVDLGSQTTGGIPTSTWDGDRYLEITINGEPLTPRELIRSVPIAGMALTVPDGAITTEKIADGAVTSEKLHSNLELGLTEESGTYTASIIASEGSNASVIPNTVELAYKRIGSIVFVSVPLLYLTVSGRPRVLQFTLPFPPTTDEGGMAVLTYYQGESVGVMVANEISFRHFGNGYSTSHFRGGFWYIAAPESTP